MEQQMLTKYTSIVLMITTNANDALPEANEYNMASMTCQIKEQDMEIASLKMELEKSKKISLVL